MTPAEFTRKLRKLINRNDVIALLDQGDFAPGGDWGAGGCWILAAALKSLLGSKGHLWAVLDARDIPQHVAVKHGNLYLDYRGARTREKFLRDVRDDLMVPSTVRLAPFTRKLQSQAAEAGIPYDPKIARKLVALMRAEF